MFSWSFQSVTKRASPYASISHTNAQFGVWRWDLWFYDFDYAADVFSNQRSLGIRTRDVTEKILETNLLEWRFSAMIIFIIVINMIVHYWLLCEGYRYDLWLDWRRLTIYFIVCLPETINTINDWLYLGPDETIT